MSKITGNEPAVGFGYCTADGNNRQEYTGLTIQQHFANTAPNEIPDWFVHVPPPKIKEKLPSWHDIENEEDQKICKDWVQDGFFDLPEHLKWFSDKYDKYCAQKVEWEKQNKVERFFQWRTFYANGLINELNKTQP